MMNIATIVKANSVPLMAMAQQRIVARRAAHAEDRRAHNTRRR